MKIPDHLKELVLPGNAVKIKCYDKDGNYLDELTFVKDDPNDPTMFRLESKTTEAAEHTPIQQ